MGAPIHWGPGAVQQFLENRGMQEVSGLGPPRTRSQGWIFTAKAGVEGREFKVGSAITRIRPYTTRGATRQEQEAARIETKSWTKSKSEKEKEKQQEENGC